MTEDKEKNAQDEAIRLQEALGPFISGAVQSAVNKNSRRILRSLWPEIGPMIRDTVAEFFAGMVQNLSEVLDHSLSLRSWKWRWEAWRSGKTFSEVALLHSLLYRVERCFLMHRESGLVLHYVARLETSGPLPEDVDEKRRAHAQLMAGMLTAIQDFVGESFGIWEEAEVERLLDDDESIHAFQIGRHHIWIEKGEHCALVAFISGVPPRDLRALFQDTIRKIEGDFFGDKGELDDREETQREIEQCLRRTLVFRGATGESKLRVKLKAALVGVTALLAVIWWTRQEVAWRHTLTTLRHTPGIVVTDWGKSRSGYFVKGWRDPAVELPPLAVPREELRLELEPFVSLEPQALERRFSKVLAAPPGLHLQYDERRDLWRVRGTAPNHWIREHAPRLSEFFGNLRYDLSGLLVDEKVALQRAKASLERSHLYFGLDSAVPTEADVRRAREFATTLAKLQAQAKAIGLRLRVSTEGFTDPTGPLPHNRQLAEQRAEVAKALLRRAGLPLGAVRIVHPASVFGANPQGMVDRDCTTCRRVDFIVDLVPEKRAE